MTTKEIKNCAVDTLSFFMQTMPDLPFKEGDILFIYAKKKDMAESAKAFCKEYVPDKIINESQTQQLNESIAANALIGREKSAVLVCMEYKVSKNEWRQLFFHEFMHIYCAKTEMDGEHFIEIFGSGTTPEEPEDKEYDGYVSAGYFIWSEFIAQYYALRKIPYETYNFPEVVDYVYSLLCEVTVEDLVNSKAPFSMACAYLLTCGDADEILNPPSIPDSEDTAPYEKENKAALLDCLRLLNNRLQNKKPWKITEEFICNLGYKFHIFRMMNSFYLGTLHSEDIELDYE